MPATHSTNKTESTFQDDPQLKRRLRPVAFLPGEVRCTMMDGCRRRALPAWDTGKCADGDTCNAGATTMTRISAPVRIIGTCMLGLREDPVHEVPTGEIRSITNLSPSPAASRLAKIGAAPIAPSIAFGNEVPNRQRPVGTVTELRSFTSTSALVEGSKASREIGKPETSASACWEGARSRSLPPLSACVSC
ncbi:hypothetical protein CONLIGDRAFT_644214 [Coniochaeta ligniaria NRRL 30616]|uniref:Uncharacterized protein n=1 Tax=Coniochaeta ligniaria NRRL 30616 TaxID=1408157 RepID=A0A1J7ISQ6_9PEZI|nr:hypothetical protein CONLIGDRAFT_644214 [Coniochaeta ligniaria NRRL 30616]